MVFFREGQGEVTLYSLSRSAVVSSTKDELAVLIIPDQSYAPPKSSDAKGLSLCEHNSMEYPTKLDHNMMKQHSLNARYLSQSS